MLLQASATNRSDRSGRGRETFSLPPGGMLSRDSSGSEMLVCDFKDWRKVLDNNISKSWSTRVCELAELVSWASVFLG